MERPYLLEVSHLTKSYADELVLDNLSFQVAPAAIHAVLGEDGAGKTTLMKILGGYIPVGEYTGEITLAGQPLRSRTIHDSLRRGIAIVPRKLSVFEALSVAENVTMASWQLDRHFLTSRRAAENEAQAVFERWSIPLDVAAPVRSLSPVQRRLLMMAAALATNPTLVVLDEPMTGMPGPHAISQVMLLVRRMAERGVTTLYLARRANDATAISDCITVLRDGTAVGQWDRADFDETALITAMASRRERHTTYVPGEDDFKERGSLLRDLFDHMLRPGR